jgi:hypothetical protein
MKLMKKDRKLNSMNKEKLTLLILDFIVFLTEIEKFLGEFL